MLSLLPLSALFFTAFSHAPGKTCLFLRPQRISRTTAVRAMTAASPLHSISPPCPVRDTRHTKTIHRALPSTRHMDVRCKKGMGAESCLSSKNSRRSCLPASMRTAIYMPDTARGRKIRWHQVNSTIPAASPRALTPLCEPVPGFFPLPPARQNRFQKNTRTTSAIIRRVRVFRSTGSNGPQSSTPNTVTARTASPAAPMMIASILSFLPVSMQQILIPAFFFLIRTNFPVPETATHTLRKPSYKSP